MHRSRRALVFFALLMGAVSTAIAIASIKRVLPDTRIVGIGVLILWAVAFIVLRNRMRGDSADSPLQDEASDRSLKDRYLKWARFLGKLYLITGSAVLVLAGVVPKNKNQFLAAGIVVLCFAAYLLFISRPKRPSQPKPGIPGSRRALRR
jgi:peptidoglycan/LPS O-acetylase OafA/YrhL